MSFWFWNGLRRGIQSTRYPRVPESAAGVTPGRPVTTAFDSAVEAVRAASNCPVGAITAAGVDACVDLGTCIHCQRCRFGNPSTVRWVEDFEWTQLPVNKQSLEPLPSAFKRSLHIMVVDAGDCGACLHEIKQLNNPLYNIHRLGMFFTATPRTADILLVVGPVSENMRGPLLKTYDAMPQPKRVVAVGSCAITGSIFGQTFASVGSVGMVLPVDAEVPGNPPPPLAILHSLLVLTGRKALETSETTAAS
jgi:Ni,Fe-hydrogenase III small subunit